MTPIGRAAKRPGVAMAQMMMGVNLGVVLGRTAQPRAALPGMPTPPPGPSALPVAWERRRLAHREPSLLAFFSVRHLPSRMWHAAFIRLPSCCTDSAIACPSQPSSWPWPASVAPVSTRATRPASTSASPPSRQPGNTSTSPARAIPCRSPSGNGAATRSSTTRGSPASSVTTSSGNAATPSARAPAGELHGAHGHPHARQTSAIEWTRA